MELGAQPVQLRLGFTQPSGPVTLHLVLSGGQILVETEPERENEAWSYLSAAGASPSMGQGRGLSFPASQLSALRELPHQVHTLPDENLATLYALMTNPSDENRPAELSVESDSSMWLSWFDGRMNWTEPLPTEAAAALLTADFAFVATADAFEALRVACQLPLLVGRTRLNPDSYVEITTAKPQLVEGAPLPGLFRVDDTHFGLALPHAGAIDAAPGFVWEGHRPLLDQGPSELPPMPMPLSSHSATDLRSLVDNLAAYRSQAIVWDSGLGRRVFALAAIEALDAWPLLIVCSPAAVWAWQRHLEMFGRSCALTHLDSDAHIVTYHDLVHRPDVYHGPQAVIFDELTTVEVLNAGIRSALRRLDGLTDSYRLGVFSRWPEAAADIVDVMSVLRPAEFRPDLPIAQRYPPNAEQRMREHAGAYLSRRRRSDSGIDATSFRRSSVATLTPTKAQREALEEALDVYRPISTAVRLAESLEVLSAGPSFSLSPKVPAAIARAQAAVNAGRRTAVLTRYRRTATLITATLRSANPVTVEAATALASGTPQARLVIVRFDRELPDLRWFDEVIVVDYPWSTELLDNAVGPASSNEGPLQVTFLHLTGTLDDRLSMMAARRRELGHVIDQSAFPSDDDMKYLLQSR